MPYTRNLGSIFETEAFAMPGETQLRHRPTSAKALLHNLTSKGKADDPLAFLSADEDDYDPMEAFDKGHLIANQFINENDTMNIVPMHSSFNQSGGVWRRIESALETEVKQKAGVTLEIEVKYFGTDGRVPSSFVLTAKRKDGSFVDFESVTLNKVQIQHLPTAAVRMTIDELQTQLSRTIFLHAYTGTKEIEWKAESLDRYDYIIVNKSGALADAKAVPRPYAFLDYLWLVDPGSNAVKVYMGRKKPQGGIDFSDRQKALIRLVNRVRNGGVLKSDYPTDKPNALIQGSGKDSAQVDHVRPQAHYGPNLFSNAMIASGEFNNAAKTTDPVTKYKTNFF